MIDRLPPPDQAQVPERRVRAHDNGPRGDFQDWLQVPVAPQDDPAHESTTTSVNATRFQGMALQPSALGNRIHEPMGIPVAAPQCQNTAPDSRALAATTVPLTAMDCQDAPPGATPTDVHVQLQFVERDGRQETVVVPMRLAATGRLAWATSTHITDLPTAMSGDHSPRLAEGSALLHQRTNAEATQRALSTGDTASMRVPSHHVAGEPYAQAEPDDTDVHFTRTRLAAVAESWLERLIRWTQRHGHNPIVWVRDYRLDDGDARDLARSLRLRANAEGFELARIVVNGRELWRAPSHSYSQEKP